MDSQQSDFLQSVHSLLFYHQALGVDFYPAEKSLLRFLEQADGLAETSAPSLETARTKVVSVAASPPVGLSLKDIAAEIRSCNGCSLHTKRLFPVPGDGSEHPRLLIVGGGLVGGDETGMSSECILGPEEDHMVSRMLSAIMLPPEKAFITNIVKCAIPDTCQPAAGDIHACFPYLLRQIAVLDPEIICTMGIVATRALLKNSLPLSQLRGKFYPFAVSDRKSIPVIPTYHPTFLLKNPDFKRATWEDLQSIAKLLRIM